MTHAHLLQQLEDDVRAKVASGEMVPDALEKARDGFAVWLNSDLEEISASVYTAEEMDLRRALKMEA